MRDIKFRAWDKKRNEYVYFDFELLSDETKTFFIEQIKGNQIEQYTGLKDKNGKEIYEGDIVGFINRNNIFGVVEWDNNGSFVFRWDSKTAKVRREECRLQIPTNLKMWEVIGNIHENAELLK